ncbi:Phosphoinositide phosphatase [Arachis hypogaea]|nr:Phosphoinositide phosphatase [Arachis hypogaea]
MVLKIDRLDPTELNITEDLTVYSEIKCCDLLKRIHEGNKDFHLTIIARRSRHYAGTRYLKRGVNEKGRVANDVETEQIVFADARDGSPMKISFVVQIRVSKKDNTFEATRLHFENLVKRYGNPIIILNLIKTHEKKPRETILKATNVLTQLGKVAAYALKLTGVFTVP